MTWAQVDRKTTTLYPGMAGGISHRKEHKLKVFAAYKLKVLVVWNTDYRKSVFQKIPVQLHILEEHVSEI